MIQPQVLLGFNLFALAFVCENPTVRKFTGMSGTVQLRFSQLRLVVYTSGVSGWLFHQVIAYLKPMDRTLAIRKGFKKVYFGFQGKRL